MANKIRALQRFRVIAIIEGISYLILLFIAMPLKYFADQPLAVKYFGWTHGFLFVLYCFSLLQVWILYKWNFGRSLFAFILSLIPFGTFILEKRLKQEATNKKAYLP
jgi:integral membrane protein